MITLSIVSYSNLKGTQLQCLYLVIGNAIRSGLQDATAEGVLDQPSKCRTTERPSRSNRARSLLQTLLRGRLQGLKILFTDLVKIQSGLLGYTRITKPQFFSNCTYWELLLIEITSYRNYFL